MLTIKTYPGYDRRDEPGDQNGARGLILGFHLVSNIGWAATLEVHTGWMARPLLRNGVIPGGPQQRRNCPGLDGTEGSRDLAAAVHLCVRADLEDCPDYFSAPSSEQCPHLGVPCRSEVGYMVADGALEALLDGGEDALEEYLRGVAKDWMSQ